MMISKKRLGFCSKLIEFGFGKHCGDWSLKHDEYYYCEDCFKKGGIE